jgi:S1-C subfamily serine protease
MRWDPNAASQPGIVVASVEPGKAAATGGLKAGDRIVRFGDWDVASPDTFRPMVWAAKNPVLVRVWRAGRQEPLDLSLTLSGNPSRLGISWRTDDAEPGVPVISRVLPGSSAELAGLRINDRIYRITGREFASLDEFKQLVSTLPGPVELTVETNGRLRIATLHPIAEITREADAPKE